jgi:hypothetical protein
MTFWGYDNIRRDSPLDMDTWHRIPAFKARLLSPEFGGLLEATDAPRACAVLLSKANQVYSAKKYYVTDESYENFYRAVLTAHVPCDVLYDEDVFAGALGRYKAVFLPGLEHLTPELKDAIAAYEKAGGRTVEWPALNPVYADHEITKGNVKEEVDVSRPGRESLLPDQYRKWREAQAKGIFDKVADLMDVRVDRTDVIMNLVVIGGKRYAVLVNDRRTYGEWTKERGHKWAEDKGDAVEAKITIGRGDGERSITVKLPAAGCVITGI